MKIDVLEKEDDRIKFILEGTTPAFANALRRTIIARTPTLAIEEVRIIENQSGLMDEMLAHRLGMIPWTFDPEGYEEGDSVTFVLKREGGEVYAKHLKPSDNSIEPTNPDILVVKLLDNQELDLEAEAIIGYGTEHAKWQAAVASYQYYPDISISDDVKPQDMVKEYPDVFEIRKKKLHIKDRDAFMAHYRSGAFDDVADVTEQDDTFIFTVESTSGFPAADIVTNAAETLLNDLKAFKKQV